MTLDSSTSQRLTLTDFDFAGVNVTPGTNDRVATVVIRTLATFNRPLSVFVNAPLLILDTPNIEPTPVPDFNAIKAGVAEAMPIVLQPVPEPSIISLLVLAVGGICLRLRRCHRRSNLIDAGIFCHTTVGDSGRIWLRLTPISRAQSMTGAKPSDSVIKPTFLALTHEPFNAPVDVSDALPVTTNNSLRRNPQFAEQ